MSKTIISQKILGLEFSTVVFNEAIKLAEEKGLDENTIYNHLLSAPSAEDIKKIIKENFSDELIIQFG
jgi:hypothetical protein